MNDTQKVILDIFACISNICKKNGIRYFAIGGTCLGAVRHQGFIPWDDDLDIAIPIQEYDKFWKIAHKELPHHLKIYKEDDIRHYRYIFGKIHNENTTFIEKSEIEYPESYKGIFVDIMPISSIPDARIERKGFYNKIRKYHKLNILRRYNFSEMVSIKEKLLWLLLFPSRFLLKTNYWSNKWLKMLSKYPLGSTSLTGYTWSIQAERLTFPINDFKDVVELPFENITISCPKEYDDYLARQFGNYMELPPVDKRAPHHVENISTTKSYKEYKKGEIQ